MDIPFLKKLKQAEPESPVFYLLTGIGSSLDSGANAGDTGATLRQLTFGMGAGSRGSRQNKLAVTLVPMRSASHETFTFPFSSTVKVRTALKLRVMPWSAAGEFEIFPVVTNHVGRGVSGVVWYVSPNEFARLDALNSDADTSVTGAKNLVWPAPLPFVSAVEGTGVTMFADRENLCSILWQNDLPILSRWRPRPRIIPQGLSGATSDAGDAIESELAWFDKYCTDQNLPRGQSYMMDITRISPDQINTELEDIARASLTRCPWLMSVNLSRTALEGARDLERSVSLMTKAACWVFLMGALVLGGNILKWREAQAAADSVRAQSEKLYRETFDPTRTGRISNPVTLARDRIAEIQGARGTGRSLGTVLADLGSVFTENPSMDVAIDILRYNTDGMDCTGLAPDMSTVLSFRKAWEERASLSQLDNTQSVSNAGYRFDLRVRWQDQPR